MGQKHLNFLFAARNFAVFNKHLKPQQQKAY